MVLIHSSLLKDLLAITGQTPNWLSTNCFPDWLISSHSPCSAFSTTTDALLFMVTLLRICSHSQTLCPPSRGAGLPEHLAGILAHIPWYCSLAILLDCDFSKVLAEHPSLLLPSPWHGCWCMARAIDMCGCWFHTVITKGQGLTNIPPSLA